jgi:hypothetical protein
MPDVDTALDELRRFADRPPRGPLQIGEVAERAGRQRRRRRIARGLGGLLVAVGLVGGAALVTTRGDGPTTTVVAGPPDSRAPASPAGPLTEPEPGDPAVWVTDPELPPSASASSFTALVTRLGCSSGETGRILRPGVVVTDTEIIVRFSAEALGDGYYECPSNDYVPYRVEIAEPIGERSIIDGECRSGGQAEGTAFCNEEAALGVRWRPQSGATTTPLFAQVDTSTPEAHQSALATGVMPDLQGVDFSVLGDDGTGVLFDLRDVIGQQQTVYVASDAPEGTVIAQEPQPGVPLDEIEAWSLTVSEGGPVVRFDELPPDVAAFAVTLAGFNAADPLKVSTTDAGTVYKTDRWLFGLDCAAVNLAYRTFADARYDTACPGFVNAPGQ